MRYQRALRAALLFGLITAAISCEQTTTVEICADTDGDGYGHGKPCGGPDCNDADPICWEDPCCTSLDCVDGDGDGYGIGADCLGPDCDEGEITCWEGTCCEPPPCGNHCAEFSIVLLPDTQHYTSMQANNAGNTYYKQMQWIIDRRDELGIEFVIHLGDITDGNKEEQWAIADQAHAMLDVAGVPYSMVPGNHDYFSPGGFSRSETNYGDYFGPDRFADRPWYGGSLDAENLNNYTFF